MAFNFDTLPIVDKEGCITIDGQKYFLKSPPEKRIGGTLKTEACELEVVASKFYQFLLGEENSPNYNMVIVNKVPYTVASEFIPSHELGGGIFFKGKILNALPKIIAILAAAYILGESDLNVASIRLTETGETIKIDHDHSLTPNIHPFSHLNADKLSLALLNVESDDDTILSWCGFREGDAGPQLISEYKNYLKTTSANVLDNTAKDIFLKFASLTSDEVKEMVKKAIPEISKINYYV